MEQARTSGVDYCEKAMAKDSSCSKEWIALGWNNGHCKCYPKDFKCTGGTREHKYQFKKKAGGGSTGGGGAACADDSTRRRLTKYKECQDWVGRRRTKNYCPKAAESR